jgi:uncharacterized protein YjbJ (UPF0337 family)
MQTTILEIAQAIILAVLLGLARWVWTMEGRVSKAEVKIDASIDALKDCVTKGVCTAWGGGRQKELDDIQTRLGRIEDKIDRAFERERWPKDHKA